MPQAWLARFGRTVADQVLDAVQGRFAAGRLPGVEVSVAGQSLASVSPERTEAIEEREAAARLGSLADWFRDESDEDGGRRAGSRALTGRDFLTGSSFAFTGGTAQTGFGALWGRGRDLALRRA